MTASTTNPSIRAHAICGALLIGLGLGGFAAFANAVQMPGAVLAGGTVTPDGHRRTVQHLEGGIVEDILVREGDRVRAGDPLIRLDTTRVRATLSMLEAEMVRQRAREARLVAELALAGTVVFPPELETNSDASNFVAAERRLFEARRVALGGQVSVLKAKGEQLAESLAGLEAQRNAARNQLERRRTERAGVDALVGKGALPKTRLDDLDREIDRLVGVLGSANAQIAVNRAARSEAGLQVVQAENTYQQTASDGLAEAVARMSELAEKTRVARDSLDRSLLVAPVDGTIQDLKVVTRGGVISPAQALLDIVPASDRLVVEARIPITEIDDLEVGLSAELRFPGFHGRDLPEIRGVVARLSADALIDAERNVSFYRASIDVDIASLPPRIAAGLQPGMPVEAVVVTHERSLADYLWEPVRGLMRGAMSET